MYKADSKIAEEFIDHQEILDTLEYAHNNKSNRALIEQLIDKAAQFKGLSHREAALLLECDQPDLTERIFRLAQEIKHKFYGNRIVMFAPLYLSNYCVNGCVYCPYHLKNKTIARKKLTQEEIRKEVIALQDMGHKRLALEAGEDPLRNPIEYILESIQTIYSSRPRRFSLLTRPDWKCSSRHEAKTSVRECCSSVPMRLLKRVRDCHARRMPSLNPSARPHGVIPSNPYVREEPSPFAARLLATSRVQSLRESSSRIFECRAIPWAPVRISHVC